MRNRTCVQCNRVTTNAVRTAALGRFARLCPECSKEFELSLRLPAGATPADLVRELEEVPDLEEVPCR